MTLEQLRALMVEAAADLVAREARPLPITVVVPLPASTRVTTLPGFPEDDQDRFDLLARFAAEVMVPANAPCFGFLAEAEADGADVLLAAFGARRRGAQVMAAALTEAGLGEFGEPEELDPAALPFLRPLQHAADIAEPAG